jgi:inorganic pyrophosphatase
MESMVFDVVIEIPAGSRNKYEINKDNHLLLIWNKGLGRIQLWMKIN